METKLDESTVRQWVVHFSSGDRDMKDKPRSGQLCTAVTLKNEECLDHLFSAYCQISLGTVSGAKYFFQYVGSNGDNGGILQRLH